MTTAAIEFEKNKALAEAEKKQTEAKISAKKGRKVKAPATSEEALLTHALGLSAMVLDAAKAEVSEGQMARILVSVINYLKKMK